jgi:hypothetical protein
MATKKKEAEADIPKFLTVRSVEAGRNRSGYAFNRDQVVVDTGADGLTEEEVQAILDDPYLVTMESDSKPSKATMAERRDSNGNVVNAFAADGYETATPKQAEALEAGEEPPRHPSAPGGGTSSPTVEGEIERAKGTLRDLEPTALTADTKGDKKSSK